MTRRAAQIQLIVCAAGVAAEAAIYGNKFMILDAVGLVEVEALDSQGETIADLVAVPKGLIVGTRNGYSRLKITSPIGQTVTVIHADADVNLAGISGTVTTAPQLPNTVTEDVKTVNAAATTLVAPAGATGVLLQADDANTDVIWLSVTTGKGHKLAASGTVTLDIEAGTTINLIGGAAGQTLYALWSIRL
jgi:hypothetical protein